MTSPCGRFSAWLVGCERFPQYRAGLYGNITQQLFTAEVVVGQRSGSMSRDPRTTRRPITSRTRLAFLQPHWCVLTLATRWVQPGRDAFSGCFQEPKRGLLGFSSSNGRGHGPGPAFRWPHQERSDQKMNRLDDAQKKVSELCLDM